jgi:hypothetical protein
VADCCECGDEPSGSCATELVILLMNGMSNHVHNTTKELYIVSDGCPGQNRNHTVVRFLATLTTNERFNKIFQYICVGGHSYTTGLLTY